MAAKPVPARAVLDQLVSERKDKLLCAAFCTFTLDQPFFEEQVLRTVLDLQADPDEDTRRFLLEARHRLMETPVVCFVDETRCGAGHRLPYSLVRIGGRTFHPKLALLVFPKFARLLIGSGNLTSTGCGGNAELFGRLELNYDQPLDVALLFEVRRFLDQVEGLTRDHPNQYATLRQTLTSLLPRDAPRVDAKEPALQFLHSEGDAPPLLEQFLALIPKKAQRKRVGVLAPFFEEDSADAFEKDSFFSVLDRLLQGAPGVPLDVGLAWEGVTLAAPDGPISKLADRLGQPWALRRGEVGKEQVEFLTPTVVQAQTLRYLDAEGQSRTMKLLEAEQLRETRCLWPLPPVGYAPNTTLHALAKRGHEVQPWLFPDRHLYEGRPATRTLHAKLFLVTVEHSGKTLTYVLFGSPNVSRKALLLTPSRRGNVETAMVFALEEEHRLRDFAPPLVFCPLSVLELRERQFPAINPGPELPVRIAIHDPDAQTLTIEFVPDTSLSESLRLSYQEQTLTTIHELPKAPLVIDGFTLAASSCELTGHLGTSTFPIPILVTDLAKLPLLDGLPALTLAELLAHLCRRLTREQLERAHRAQDGAVPVSSLLEQLFGERFGPDDVFRAWHSLAVDLADSALSVPGFRVRLEGPMGARGVWTAMKSAVMPTKDAKAAPELTAVEAWFYGAELVRTLAAIRFADDPLATDKQTLLEAFLAALKSDLRALSGPLAQAQSQREGQWLPKIRAFYKV